jgi:hypothetical protein
MAAKGAAMIFEITCKCCGQTFENANRKRAICFSCRRAIDPTNTLMVLPEPQPIKNTSPMDRAKAAYSSAYLKAFRNGLTRDQAIVAGRKAYAEEKRRMLEPA